MDDYICFYEYAVLFWDEVENKHKEAHGLTYGVSNVDALEKIAKYYGDDNIINISRLYCAVDNKVFEFEYANEWAECNYNFVPAPKE